MDGNFRYWKLSTWSGIFLIFRSFWRDYLSPKRSLLISLSFFSWLIGAETNRLKLWRDMAIKKIKKRLPNLRLTHKQEIMQNTIKDFFTNSLWRNQSENKNCFYMFFLFFTFVKSVMFRTIFSTYSSWFDCKHSTQFSSYKIHKPANAVWIFNTKSMEVHSQLRRHFCYGVIW